jgi:hypothetical protein
MLAGGGSLLADDRRLAYLSLRVLHSRVLSALASEGNFMGLRADGLVHHIHLPRANHLESP